MVAPQLYAKIALPGQQSLQLQHPLARHDDLLLRQITTINADLGKREPVTVRGDGPQQLSSRLQQQAVQVVPDILLRHRKVRLVQQTSQRVLGHHERLTGADVLDGREFGRRQASPG